MSKEKICGIYCIENLANHKKYIGQSIDIYTRWVSHKYELNRGNHRNVYLQRSWNKYKKENFEFSILEVCDSIYLNEKEEYWIYFFNSFVEGYNLTEGGLHNPMDYSELKTKALSVHIGNKYWLGRKHTEEEKRKISESNKGKKFSKETKEKLSKAKTGIKVEKHTGDKHSLSKKVVQVNKETNEYIQIFDSINLAEILFSGKRTGNIQKAVSKNFSNKTAYGYKWIYLEDGLTDVLYTPVKNK